MFRSLPDSVLLIVEHTSVDSQMAHRRRAYTSD
jgi:hypothetical protein